MNHYNEIFLQVFPVEFLDSFDALQAILDELLQQQTIKN